MLLSSRRWRTRCSSPNARASPRMGSRTSTHRCPIPLFCYQIHCLPKKAFADSPKDSACPTSPPTERHVPCFQRGVQNTSLSIYVYVYLLTHPSANTRTKFPPFLISFVASNAWRGCNLHSLVFETGTCVSSSYQRRLYVCSHAYSRLRLYVWVCIMNVYVCVTLTIFVFMPYPVEQRRWDPTSDRWYNWTGRTILTGQFSGITFLKPLCLNSSRQLYSCAAEQRISCASRNFDEFDMILKDYLLMIKGKESLSINKDGKISLMFL